MNTLLEVKQLNVSYRTIPVLKDISLSINENQFFGLVGMNGSGKTTLIKSILDLIDIDSGEINLFGKKNIEMASRQHVAYLPDRFSPPAYLTGKEFIVYMQKLSQTEVGENEINMLAEKIELDKSALSKSINSLSKGMTQKIGLMSCLLGDTKLIILDEPMSGLDPGARHCLKNLLKEKKQNGCSVFFTSHSLGDVEELADVMAVLHEGEINYTGDIESFRKQYKSDSLEHAYLQAIAR